MQIPAAAMIDVAEDELEHCVDADTRLQQLAELEEHVGDRATPDFKAGYELGIQTARVMLATNVEAQAMGVTDVL